MDTKELGRLGGLARAQKLSAERRYQIAKQGGEAARRAFLKRQKQAKKEAKKENKLPPKSSNLNPRIEMS